MACSDCKDTKPLLGRRQTLLPKPKAPQGTPLEPQPISSGNFDQARNGLMIDWGAVLRTDNETRYVVRQCMVQAPRLTCLAPRCVLTYYRDSIRYAAVMLYHKHRVAYAVRNKRTEIPMRYRTGEPSPMTTRSAFLELVKLKIRR